MSDRESPSAEAIIRSAKQADLPAIADVHVQAFPGFVLTRLGRGFLRQYYEAVMEFPDGILLVAESEDRVAGFVAGFTQPEGFSRHLRRRTLRLVPHILAGIVRNPGLVLIVAQNALGVFSGSGAGPEHLAGEAELSSIGVVPEHQGHGLGRKLTNAFVDAAAKLGATGVYLYTDAVKNEGVNAFYRSLGFTVRRSYMASGRRPRNEYYRRLT